MIIVITVKAPNSRGEQSLIASHGVREDMSQVVLPPEHPMQLGAKFHQGLGEWVLPEEGDYLEVRR